MHYALTTVISVSLMFAVFGEKEARADVAAGRGIAQRWCVNCHIISGAQSGAVQQGPPTFPEIAKSGMSADRLRAFLSHPHGAMPDLALSRTEIDDLILYIQSLR
jgi:cytochrome c